MCVQAVSVRLRLDLTGLLRGAGGARSAASRDWSPFTAGGPCRSMKSPLVGAQRRENAPLIVRSGRGRGSPLWDLLRFLGLRLRV